jgi:hypothetical protein
MAVVTLPSARPISRPPNEAPDEAPRAGETTMRHLTSTIQRLDLPHDELPARDRAATEGRAWLLRRLRWEHRLAELRSEHERASRT